MTIRWVGTGMCAVVLASATVRPAHASHCEYCNEGLPSGAIVEPSVLPPDGVLMISLTDARARVLPASWWASVRVEVRDATGEMLPGTLEVYEDIAPAVWTPDGPWPSGPLTVTVAGDLDPDCAWEHEFDVEVDPELAPPPFPTITIEEVYKTEIEDELDNLVCCDGAAPFEQSVPGVLCPGYRAYDVQNSEGFCTHVRESGKATVTATLVQDTPSRFAFNGRRSANGTDRVRVTTQDADCFAFEVIDLVSGATQTAEHCVVEHPDQPLGAFVRPEVNDELRESCEGPAYVCEQSWARPQDCALWLNGWTDMPDRPGIPTTGCNAGGAPPTALSVLFMVGFLWRRRTSVLAGLLAILCFPRAAQASHCEGCEAPRPVAVGLAANEVGPDSVLVLTLEPSLPSYGIPVDPALWDTVGVEVSTEDGLPIPGVLQPRPGFSVAEWHPETTFETGTYHLSVHIQPEDECPAIDETLSFDVVASPAPTPSTEITVEDTLRVQTIPALDNYVCCDGAAPFMPSPPGSGCHPQPPTVEWIEGSCAAIEEDHVLDVEASLEEGAAGIFTLRETTTGARPTTGSLSLALTRDTQDCLEFEVLDLRSGTITTSSWCPDETLALGRLPREALEAELAASCLGPAYQCERFDRCTPWPDGSREPDASTGDASDSDGAPASGEPRGCSTGSPETFGLALLMLLAAIPRPRTQPHTSAQAVTVPNSTSHATSSRGCSRLWHEARPTSSPSR